MNIPIASKIWMRGERKRRGKNVRLRHKSGTSPPTCLSFIRECQRQSLKSKPWTLHLESQTSKLHSHLNHVSSSIHLGRRVIDHYVCQDIHEALGSLGVLL
jgi:hypothetical protein